MKYGFMYVFYVMFDGVCGYFCWGFYTTENIKGKGMERDREIEIAGATFMAVKSQNKIKKTSRTMECCLKCIISIICSSSKLMYNCYCFLYESLWKTRRLLKPFAMSLSLKFCNREIAYYLA